MQKEDSVIAPVWYAVKKDPDNRPVWNEINRYCAVKKAYFADRGRLKIINGVLYRIWKSSLGLNKSYHLITPRKFQQKLDKRIHDAKNAAHMGRRKTMHAMLHFCY